MLGGDSCRSYATGEEVRPQLELKWEFHAAHPSTSASDFRFDGQPVVGFGKVFLSTLDEIVALDARTGEQLWKREKEEPSLDWHGPLCLTEVGQLLSVEYKMARTYRDTEKSNLVALDANTGEILWHVEDVYSEAYPRAVQGLVLSVDKEGKILLVDTKTGQAAPVLWQGHRAERIDAARAETDANGDLDRLELAWDCCMGVVGFKESVYDRVQRTSSVQRIPPKFIFQRPFDHWVEEPHRGGNTFVHPLSFQPAGARGGSETASYCVKGGRYPGEGVWGVDNRIYCFDVGTAVLWMATTNTLGLGEATADHPIGIRGQLALGDNLIYASIDYSKSMEGREILALDRKDGKVRWRKRDLDGVGDMVLSGDVLYTVSGKGGQHRLFALDAATGKLLWQSPDNAAMGAGLVVGEGTVFVTTVGRQNDPESGRPALGLQAWGPAKAETQQGGETPH